MKPAIFPFALAFACLTGSISCLMADVVDSAVPAVIEQANPEATRTRDVFDSVNYVADITVRTFNEMRSLDREGMAIKNVPLAAPAESRVRVDLKRAGENQLIIVEPVQVAQEHKLHSFASRSIYQLDGDTIRVFSEGDQILRIDSLGGLQGILPRPHDLTLPDDLFKYHLTSRWPEIYGGLTPEQANDLLKANGIKKSIEANKGEDPATIVATEEFTIDHLITSLGPVGAKRIISYSRASGWMPTKVTQLKSGHKRFVLELEWGQIGDGNKNTWFPRRIVASKYFPAESKPDAEDILMEQQVIDLDPKAVASGEAVRQMDFSYDFPDSAKVFQLPGPSTQPAEGAQGSKASPHHAFPPLLLAALILVGLTSFVELSRRIKQQKNSGQR